jgi:hypothetical protein
MQVVFKTYFLQSNILFKYVSSIFYQRENKFIFWWGLWISNDFYVIISQMYISLNFLMKK